MKNVPEEEFVDIKRIISALTEKWYYFVISVPICLLLAIVYLKTAPDVYQVRATLQLKDQSLSDKGVGQEKFINGLELLSGDSELEDEIGVLSSYSMVESTIEQLGTDISYFQYPDLPFIGELMEEEIYQTGFRVNPDPDLLQIVGVPVHISFPDAQHYAVEAEADEATLFNIGNQTIIQEKIEVSISDTLPLDQPFNSSILNFSLALDSGFVVPEDQKYYFIMYSRASLAESYTERLSISPISEESNIVSLSIDGRVAQKEKDFLNTLAETYIQSDLQKKNRLGVRTIEFIDSQVSTVYDSLQSAEGNLKSFRSSNQIIDISTTSESLQERLQELESQQAELKVKQEYYQYTAKQLASNEDVSDVVAPSAVGIDDPFLNDLLTNLTELSQEKVGKSYSSNPNNPVIRVLNQKIQSTKASLLENINNLVNSNRIAVQENQRRIQRLEAQQSRLPESERNLISIERRFNLNDHIYNYLLEKRAEAGIALASNLPDKSIVDYARMQGNGRVSPNSKSTIIMAILAGLLLPIGLIWGTHLLNSRVTETKELEESASLPLTGIIPLSPKKQKLPVIESPASPIAESFRFLRLELDKISLDEARGGKVIGVTSAQQGDGKTFCSSNLAAAYARSGYRTLLMGADLRNPRLYEYFNIKEYGLAECLENSSPIEQMIQKTQLNNLRIMSGGKANVDIGILIESRSFANVMQYLRENFDVIIVDTPPISIVADYYVLERHFDINAFVVRQNQTSAHIVKGAIAKFDGFKNKALIVNEAKNSLIEEYGYQHSNNSYYTQAKV